MQKKKSFKLNSLFCVFFKTLQVRFSFKMNIDRLNFLTLVSTEFNSISLFQLTKKYIFFQFKQLINMNDLFISIPFPHGDKLPPSNNPVAIFGQVPRFQREQELEFFLSKQSNTLGLRIQNKLSAIDQQFSLQQQHNQMINESTNSISTNTTQQHQQSISSTAQLPSTNTSTSLTQEQ